MTLLSLRVLVLALIVSGLLLNACDAFLMIPCVPQPATRFAKPTPTTTLFSTSQPPAKPPTFELPPVVYLLSASALWGTYPSTIKSLFAAPGASVTPEEITLIRFLLMASLALLLRFTISPSSSPPPPILPISSQLKNRVPSSIYLSSLELSSISLLGTLLNTSGLSSLPALTGATLLTSLNVFTPMITSIFGANHKERTVDPLTWTGSLIALSASIYALLPDGSNDLKVLTNFGRGEFCVLGGSFFFAAAKVRLSSHLKYHDDGDLTTGRLVGQAGLAAAGLGIVDETNLVHEIDPLLRGGLGVRLEDAWRICEGWLGDVSGEQVLWVMASSFLSGAGALWCQGRGQKNVPAAKAQVRERPMNSDTRTHYK